MKPGPILQRFCGIALLFVVLGAELSCGQSSTGAGQLSVEPLTFTNAVAPLITPTYDGSGQAIHPGIVYLPAGWHGFNYWMVVTPYPNYNASVENPSMLASNDGRAWQVPPGLVNPVSPGAGELADGDLVYDAASDQLWMYYLRQIYPTTALVRKVSSDGTHWSNPEDVLTMPKNALLSPAVAKIANTYHLWYVNAWPDGSRAASSTVEHRTSSDGKNWSEATTCQISQPGYVIWHIDVLPVQVKNPDSGAVEDKQWMLLASFPVGTASGETKLFFADSSDSVSWTTYSQPVLGPGPASAWDSGQIYRSTLLYDQANDMIRVWYTGRSVGQPTTTPGVYTYTWNTGYTEQHYSNLHAWLLQAR